MPVDLDELISVLRDASGRSRRVSFRGGGRALDTQSLNDDLVVSLAALSSVDFSELSSVVFVGGGCLTGKLAQEALRYGHFPAVTVTTSTASVGGTLSSNCVSRFTPLRGSVANHVLALQLITASGDRVDCSPDKDADVFHGALGGLGCFGCIASATLKLDADPADQVETTVAIAGNAGDVLAACTPPFIDGATRYAVLMPKLECGITYRCRRVSGQPLKRYRLVHEPQSALRVAGELLMRSDALNRLTWWLAYHTPETQYVDPLLDHTFFMDGNSRMRELGWALGFSMRVAQQSFLLPVATANEFLHDARREFSGRRYWPSLADVLYTPRSSALLSASFGLDGLLITFGFEIVSNQRARLVDDTLIRLSSHCRRLGGRVQLTKTVRASEEDIGEMYAHALPAFIQLKRRLDPNGMLRNEFLDRVLPRHW